jgi:hypothetical protein
MQVSFSHVMGDLGLARKRFSLTKIRAVEEIARAPGGLSLLLHGHARGFRMSGQRD